MKEQWFPTEEELDALMPEAPAFDLDAVRRRTLARTAQQPRHGHAGRLLRGLCLAAVVCALSASALAVAEQVTGGGVTRALGLRREEPVQTAPAAAPEPVRPAEPVEEAAPAPEEAEPEPYGLEDWAALLQAPQETVAPLRQQVGQTTQTDSGAQLTVVETVGDGRSLYVLLRVDFPTSLALTEDLYFRDQEIQFDVEGMQYGGELRELSRTAHSITYLAQWATVEDLSGATATVRLSGFGRDRAVPEGDAWVLADGGRPTQCTFVPDGQGGYLTCATVQGETRGFSFAGDRTFAVGGGVHDLFSDGWEQALAGSGGRLGCRWSDGALAVLVDGKEDALVYLAAGAESPTVAYGAGAADPAFETVLSDTLTQSWTLDGANDTRVWELNVPLGGEDGTETAVAERLELSPLSFRLVCAAPEGTAASLSGGVTLRFADGGALELLSAGPDFTWRGRNAFVGSLDRLIDLDELTAITVFGTEIPLT